MKVLVVHNRYRSSSPSGEDQVVDREASALASIGFDIRRFERFSDEIPALPLRDKLLVPVRTVWSTPTVRQLAGAIEEFQPDIVHVHNVYPLLSPSVLEACRLEVPVVVTLHNYRPLCPTGTLFRSGVPCTDCVGRLPIAAIAHGCYRGSRLASTTIALASMVQRRWWKKVPSAYVFLSEAHRKAFADLCWPDERCFVKGNSVQVASGTRSVREPMVVYVGRLDEVKGIRFLMDAWDHSAFGRARRAVRLVIAGSGPLEPVVREWADRHEEVDVVGLISPEACRSLMSRARAVVVPSIWDEPFGLVVAEAMAAGAPPIAPRHGAFPELIQDGVDGVLFSSGDVGDLAAQLTRLVDQPGWFDDLGRAAVRTHAERFSPEGNVGELISIYRFAIEHPTESLGHAREGVTSDLA